MEVAPVPDSMLPELLAPRCLDPARPLGCPAQQEPATPGCRRPSRRVPRKGSDPLPLFPRSLWPVCQGSVAALRFLQETAEGLAQPPAQDTQALGLCQGSMALRTQGPLPLDRDSKNMLAPISLEPRGTLPAPPQRRLRKQLNPRRGAERVDPRFKGVTLQFQIKPDSSLQMVATYSLACSGHSPGPPAGPAGGPEAHPGGSEAHVGGSEALGARRCASCRTQRTPLWRDAEDGTPLCNACGIRYKKYGTRCSGCWLVPRKSVQPKRLCGRCGVSLDPHQSPAPESLAVLLPAESVLPQFHRGEDGQKLS
ncbi:GATA-type zinc finger protein 1 [Carlito syrichta]|uniref:GATA-type zinc finger protein 1 n=1 Tax=Carlito syrichta TaxID=1868482 RepID=A0A3Q0DNK2_CARSF|nr:GATA-type zinc finger protein 1 [Carlito syrichta]